MATDNVLFEDGAGETVRFHAFSYDEMVKRDKASLDIFWQKEESLESALEQFKAIYEEIRETKKSRIEDGVDTEYLAQDTY